VARAFTGRELIVKFSGCYHGHVDSLLVAAGSGAMTLGTPDSAGVPLSWSRTTLTLPFNDIAAVEAAFKKYGSRIAAVIVEPAVANMGVMYPVAGFHQALRRITRKHRALLIFDEVVTGFRLAYGGAQTLWGIKPDLTTLGKIVGGGFPIGAYGGRREIMDLVAPNGPVYQAGTLSGNPVAVAAGIACLKTLRTEKPYKRMAQLTGLLTDRIGQEAARAGLPIQIHSGASMFTVFFTGRDVRDYASAKTADTKAYGRFFHALLKEGVYFPPAQFEAAFLSAAHTAHDVERTVKAVRKAFSSI
jgi:glutamate-1-semialdehyde 2,1-aminomutase